MKNVLIGSFVIILLCLFSCNDTKAPSTESSQDKSTFLKQRENKFWHNPVCPDDYKKDIDNAILNFNEKFVNAKQLPYINGFSIRLKDFERLLKYLTVDSAPGKDTLFAIRFYPAIDSNDSLYIVLIGEIVNTKKPIPTRFYTKREGSYCILKSNYQLIEIISEPTKKEETEKEIILYQQKMKVLGIINPPSYIAYVEPAKKMFNELFPSGDDPANKTFYAINMLPALFSDKPPYTVLLATKPQKIIVDEASNERREEEIGKCYYDEMNECPQYCPTNKIE